MRPTDIVTQIHWFDADTHRPPCSGTYLASFSCGSISSMSYSKKYDAFNRTDDEEMLDAHRTLYPCYWAFMPEELTDRLEEIWNETH